jgi:hypothetical protein
MVCSAIQTISANPCREVEDLGHLADVLDVLRNRRAMDEDQVEPFGCKKFAHAPRDRG